MMHAFHNTEKSRRKFLIATSEEICNTLDNFTPKWNSYFSKINISPKPSHVLLFSTESLLLNVNPISLLREGIDSFFTPKQY